MKSLIIATLFAMAISGCIIEPPECYCTDEEIEEGYCQCYQPPPIIIVPMPMPIPIPIPPMYMAVESDGGMVENNNEGDTQWD